jgi:aminoglycoside phosphotransferase (APT) family kinase protein
VTRVWKAAPNVRDWEGVPVRIYGDLDSRNLLAKEGRRIAVIDFTGGGWK